jgi:hypothetical protein
MKEEISGTPRIRNRCAHFCDSLNPCSSRSCRHHTLPVRSGLRPEAGTVRGSRHVSGGGGSSETRDCRRPRRCGGPPRPGSNLRAHQTGRHRRTASSEGIRAESRRPEDPLLPRSGRERTGKPQKALRLYERHIEVSNVSPYRSLLQARYEWLLRQRIRREVAQKLECEQRLAGAEVSPSTVAVLPFAYQGYFRDTCKMST